MPVNITADYFGGRLIQSIGFAGFWGVNTPPVATFKLLMWCTKYQTGKWYPRVHNSIIFIYIDIINNFWVLSIY